MKNLILVVGLALVSQSSFSQQEVNQRLGNQGNRIQQGEQSGQLTPGEANKLNRQDNRIQRREQRDMQKNGGKLTPKEKRRLNRQLNRESKKIYRKKHNNVKQPQ